MKNVNDSPVKRIRFHQSVRGFVLNEVGLWRLNKNFIHIVKPNFTAATVYQCHFVL